MSVSDVTTVTASEEARWNITLTLYIILSSASLVQSFMHIYLQILRDVCHFSQTFLMV